MSRSHSALLAVSASALSLIPLHAQPAGSASDNLDLALPKLYEAFRSSSNNVDRASNDDCKRPIPGETVVLADLEGPGVVDHIWVTIAANEYGWPRLLRLRIYYDGSATASVDAPVGDFFGVGLGQERPLASTMVRDSSSGRARNCYWPMPFRKSIKITITNEGRRRASHLYYHVDWKKVKDLPAGIRYFHARYRQELPTIKGRNYELLDIKGSGHYVGTVFSVIQNEPGWFGEGDEYFYVDGAKVPNIQGTGTEDYFNDAWGLRVSEVGPYYGVTVADGTGLGSRMSAYRWHIVDPIPFTKSLHFEIEHAGWTYKEDGSVRSGFEERADLFSSVAFWYQDGIAEGLAEPPFGPARLPHGNARQIEVEQALADVKAEKGKVEVQKEVFWGRNLLVLNAEGPGARIDIPFDVEEDGNYEVLAQIAHSNDYGQYSTLLDGKPLVSDVVREHEPGTTPGIEAMFDAYHMEMYVAEDHMLGWKKLAKGRHTLSFVCTGKNSVSAGYNLGVDTLILSRLGKAQPTGGERAEAMRHSSDATELGAGLTHADPFVRVAAAWRFTQQPEAAAIATAPLAAALADQDQVVRGLAALALANCGGCAAPALPRLIAAIKDPDRNVRQKVADAIGTLGPGAVAAVPALNEAAQAASEVVQVQRSIANALGNIGPAAAAAIPALERLRANLNVQPEADSALAKIRGTR
jgi:hypothetical protein